jgi:hypothetical protein
MSITGRFPKSSDNVSATSRISAKNPGHDASFNSSSYLRRTSPCNFHLSPHDEDHRTINVFCSTYISAGIFFFPRITLFQNFCISFHEDSICLTAQGLASCVSGPFSFIGALADCFFSPSIRCRALGSPGFGAYKDTPHQRQCSFLGGRFNIRRP